jgi:hypothetical protein
MTTAGFTQVKSNRKKGKKRNKPQLYQKGLKSNELAWINYRMNGHDRQSKA